MVGDKVIVTLSGFKNALSTSEETSHSGRLTSLSVIVWGFELLCISYSIMRSAGSHFKKKNQKLLPVRTSTL